MRLTASQALRTRQDSRRLGGFGKQWKSGETLTVFYPITWIDGQPEILAAAVWGHSVSIKDLGLKRIFVPSNSQIEDGVPKVPDVLYQFSRIAPLFIQGRYEEDRKRLESKNLPSSALKTALAKIDKDYDIDETGKIGKDAAVGKLRLVISTEVVTVTMGPNGEPDADNARLVTQDLSDSKIQALYSLMKNKQYAPKEGDKYIEVTYSFGTSGDRKSDGKVAPNGVTDDYKIAHRFPDAFTRIEQQLVQLPESSDTIEKRNSSYRPVEDREIYSAIQTYSALNSDSLDSLTEEDMIERLKKNAAILDKLKIQVENEEVNQAIRELHIPISPSAEVNDAAPKMGDLIDQADIDNAREEAEKELNDIGDENSLTDLAGMAGLNQQ